MASMGPSYKLPPTTRIGGGRKRSEILNQEIPDLEEVIPRARHSQTESDQHGKKSDCCPHLRKILPDELDLEFVTTSNDGFYVKNPIHALHLSSQFDPKEDITDWLVYGEEQERALAFTTPGIVETWTSNVKNDLYPEEPHMKKMSASKNQQLGAPKEGITTEQRTEKREAAPSTGTASEVLPSPAIASSSEPEQSSAPCATLSPKPSEEVSTEEQYKKHYEAEEEIRRLRQALIGRKKSTNTAKRPRLKAKEPMLITDEEFQEFQDTQRYINGKANLILENYRQERRKFWKQGESKSPKLFGEIESDTNGIVHCRNCERTQDLRRCLECSFVGCTEDHLFQHYLTSGHEFCTSRSLVRITGANAIIAAVALDERAMLYCTPCCKGISHMVFAQERVRVDIAHMMPWFSWKEDILYRSFDCWRFNRHGYWKGFRATYPMIVSQSHIQAANLCRKRKQELNQKRPLPIPAPVGMYNLGNTCYLSSTLQALIHCVPLQRYFLEDIGHFHEACGVLCKPKANSTVTGVPSRVAGQYGKMRPLCLACEMDKLYTIYESSANGYRAWQKGSPLVTANILSSCWRAMEHLAGSEQRDAHEFLHGFLELVGKHMATFRTQVRKSLGDAALVVTDEKKDDEIKNLFEGKLRSVLICQECGNKRSKEEAFLCLSLPLEKAGGKKLTVERCLYDFTLPESLSDPVQCPSCARKTPTQKQHVLCKLPKVLVLHLKRFDARRNQKIEDLVDFEAVLNMGFYLPHWSEVTRLESNDGDDPVILYDLFATSNHFGTLESGHYVAHVKVDDRWYLINDAHVALEAEKDVLRNQNAYMLFFIRR